MSHCTTAKKCLTENTFASRMIEALLDPKTWLFALFSALDNIPNSLTNQRQIIVSSFGFTPLQTTLLGCVDGIVEITTIWTGVNFASRLPNSIAYVGVLYMIPNLMGVFLINFLPWSDKVGLLFSVWITGSFEVVNQSHILTDWYPTGVGTTGFVLSLSWLSNVTAGHTKRVTVNAVMLSAYCIGNSAGPFMWQQKYKPRSAGKPCFISLVRRITPASETTSPGSSSESVTSCACRCFSLSDTFYRPRTNDVTMNRSMILMTMSTLRSSVRTDRRKELRSTR